MVVQLDAGACSCSRASEQVTTGTFICDKGGEKSLRSCSSFNKVKVVHEET